MSNPTSKVRFLYLFFLPFFHRGVYLHLSTRVYVVPLYYLNSHLQTRHTRTHTREHTYAGGVHGGGRVQVDQRRGHRGQRLPLQARHPG
jgi:hypothetical protein